MPGITCVNSKGAVCLFPNLCAMSVNSADFCARLLEQETVAGFPA